jgi:hypothetical protein
MRFLSMAAISWLVKETQTMKELPLSKVNQLLEPGTVVLLTTAHKCHANVMTMSWHMMVEFEPPLVACVISNANHSFTALWATRSAQSPFRRWNWPPSGRGRAH